MRLIVAICAALVLAAAQDAHPRIVSLMPSLTEDLCAIGAAKQLVGVSQFSSGTCARGLPEVNDASSVDAERIVALHPDLVVGIPAQRMATLPLRRAGIAIHLFSDDSYADLFANIQELGALTGHRVQAQAMIAHLRKETELLQRSEYFTRHPSVFVVLQTNPIWTVGPQSYISTLIALAGGRNAVVSLPSAYAQFSAEALLRLQPNAIVASRDAQLTQVLDREPWRSLHAVRANHVFIVPDSSALYRPGPRYNEALSWLIARLRPIAR